MTKNRKFTIVVVDLSVKQTSPAGSCVLSELVGLAEEYKIHLLANEADDDIKKRVLFHKIDAPGVPLVLRYIIFSKRVKTKMKKILKDIEGPYIIQTTQGQYINSDISYAHFCHRAYLQKQWVNTSVTGVRKVLRKLNHLYHANKEAKAFKKAKLIVVPSKGLSEELVETYPQCSTKVKVISNPVDVVYFRKPKDFNKTDQRIELGIDANDKVIAFAALGDFSRKGLGVLIESLQYEGLENSNYKILVIGGKSNEIATYEKRASDLGLREKVIFVGFHQDIRNYLWMSDVFSLPSLYETFSLISIQAAAAGLPMMVSQLHGVEEYLEHEKNGWLIGRNPESIGKVLIAIAQGRYDIESMGKTAMKTSERYGHESFRQKWKSIYENLP